MNFRNANLLNSLVNMLSGNLLPMVGDDSRFPIVWRVYSVVVRSFELVYIVSLTAGLVLIPREKALKDGTVAVIVFVEAFFMLLCIYARKGLLKRVIRKMNDILRNADENMKDITRSVLKPVTTPFVIYAITGAISIILWTSQPIALTFRRSVFYYVDYNLPSVFSAEPFSIYVMIPSIVFMTFSSVCSFLKKFSLDVYTMHLVLMLTAQYRYTAVKLTMLFRSRGSLSRNDHYGSRRERGLKMDRLAEMELKMLCRHQNTILRISLMLKKLLSMNFSLLYLSSVFRFCFIGILLSSVPSMTLSEGISVVSFTFGSVMQFFFLCSSVQALSDASMEITDKAFDEAWYQFKPSIKRIFMLLIMANNLECKIAAVGKFNLSLPSFMTIMNQSYSIALLLLRIK